MELVLDLLREAVTATPTALVVVAGLGGASWLWRRPRGAGGLLGLGLLLIGSGWLAGALGGPLLAAAARSDVLGEGGLALSLALLATAESALRGLGVLGCLGAACAGPAPSPFEDDS